MPPPVQAGTGYDATCVPSTVYRAPSNAGDTSRFFMSIRRFSSFGLVGALATAIHVAVASTLIAGAAWPAGLANGLAFCVATLASYSLNSRLTFRRAMSRRTFWRFVAVAALGAVLSMAISGAAEWYGLHYLVGIALVVLSLPPLTFLAHSRWTYR